MDWDGLGQVAGDVNRDATQVGILLARSRTKDITDAHVVICARRNGEAIVTSDPDDLERLDPSARLFVV